MINTHLPMRSQKIKKISILFAKAFLSFLSLQFLNESSMASIGNRATRMDFLTGFYNLSAATDEGSASISHMTFKGGVRHSLLHNFEVGLSYTLFTGSFMFTDIGYGPDVGFNYYPLTDSAPTKLSTQRINLRSEEKFRPFASLFFHQRQFQSLNSSYAGFSFGGGSDYQFHSDFDLRIEGRYILLQGPNEHKAYQLDLFAGISFSI